MLHIYVSVNCVSIGSGNGLLPVQRQAITWTNADLLPTGVQGKNFSEIWIWILSFPFLKNAFENVICQDGSHLVQGGGGGGGVN